MEKVKECYDSYRKSREEEDLRVSELVKDLREKQIRAADEVRDMRAEVSKLREEMSRRPSEEEYNRLREELGKRPSEEEVIGAFRGSDDYISELNEKAAEKIFVTWEVAPNFCLKTPEAALTTLFLFIWLRKRGFLLGLRPMMTLSRRLWLATIRIHLLLS